MIQVVTIYKESKFYRPDSQWGIQHKAIWKECSNVKALKLLTDLILRFLKVWDYSHHCQAKSLK